MLILLLGAALTGLLARMATETGASVLVCHHMTKIKDNAVESKHPKKLVTLFGVRLLLLMGSGLHLHCGKLMLNAARKDL